MAGNFGAALLVHMSIYSIKGLGFIVVHKTPEVLESLSHYMVIWKKTKQKKSDTIFIIAYIDEMHMWMKVLKQISHLKGSLKTSEVEISVCQLWENTV